MLNRLLCAGLLAIAGCNLGFASDRKATAIHRTLLPVTLCLEIDNITLNGVLDGSIRLQIKIRNHQAVRRYSSGFQLFLIQQNDKPVLLHNFGLQPDRVEHAVVSPQIVQLSLTEENLMLAAQSQVCFEIRQDVSTQAAEEQVLKDIEIRWWSV